MILGIFINVISSEITVTITINNPDTDGDGVNDDVDICPDTPNGEAVDANGCSDSQKDTDGDVLILLMERWLMV